MISVSSKRRAFILAGTLALLSIASPHTAHAGTRNAGAWESLWKNDDAGAKAAFKTALTADSKDADALRGLGWIAYYADDKRGALQYWSRSIALAPGAWTSEALWPYLNDLDRDTGARAMAESAARAVAASPAASEALKASARLMLADASERRGDAASARTLRDSLRYVRDWRIIGPFDNVSKSGFEKTFAPERGIDLAGSVAGREGRLLPWRRLQLVGRSGDCAVGAALGDSDEDVYYAATAVRASADGTAAFAFDPTGASKIYCNGRLVFSDDVYRTGAAGEDVFRVTAPVRKGWNTLLIKLADNQGIAAGFRLRVLAAPGVSIDRVDAALASSDAPGASAVQASAISSPGAAAHAEFGDAVSARLPDVEAALSMGHVLTARRDYEAAEQVLRQAIAAHPDSGVLHWRLSETLTEDEQADDARAERDTALGLDNHLALAALNALVQDKGSQPAPEQLRLLKALAARFPASSDIASSLSAGYEAAQLTPDGLKASRLALRLAPGPDNLVLFADSLKEDDRKAEALALVKAAVKSDPYDPALLSELADLISDQGDAASAIAVYRRLTELQPEQPSHWRSLASLYTDSGDHASALDALRSALARQPQSASLYGDLGDALRELHRQKEALAAYQTAVDLAPEQAGLRAKLQALTGQKPVLDLVPPLPTPSLKAASGAPKAIASLTYLVDDGREVVYPNYATVAHYHVVARVNDDAAAQAYQSYPLARSTAHSQVILEQARLIKASGKIEDAASGESDGAVAFPSLAPGDTIDLSYRVEDYQRGGLAHQFWGQWGFTSYSRDVRISRFALITPPAMRFQTLAHGGVPKPTERTVGGWRIQEWRMENAPPVKQEKEGVPGHDATAWLDFSSIKDWSTIVRWYQDLSQPRVVPDSAIRARAAELTKDAKTEDDKIRAIVSFVSRDIQYQSGAFRLSAFVPTEGKEVIREHYGDCKDKAALLTALLAAEGIHSEMVLLSPRDAGLTPYLPSPRFNHAIARVDTPSGPRFIDATADQITYGDLPYMDQGAPVLLIDDHSTDLVKSPLLPVGANLLAMEYVGALTAKGAFEGTVNMTMTGNYAWVYRSALKQVPEGKMDEMLRGWCSSVLPSFTYQSGSVENVAETNAPLLLHLRCRNPHFGKPAGNFLIASVPWVDAETQGSAEQLLTDGARTQDLEIGLERGVSKLSFALDLPAGYLPQDLEPSARRDSTWGGYEFHYKLDGQTLRGDGSYTVSPDRVAATDVPGYVEMMSALEEELGKQIVLKK